MSDIIKILAEFNNLSEDYKRLEAENEKLRKALKDASKEGTFERCLDVIKEALEGK
jgi:hypothetical protein